MKALRYLIAVALLSLAFVCACELSRADDAITALHGGRR